MAFDDSAHQRLVLINGLVGSARECSGPNEKLQRQCANYVQDLIRNMGAGYNHWLTVGKPRSQSFGVS